jgi:hypothetical protein
MKCSSKLASISLVLLCTASAWAANSSGANTKAARRLATLKDDSDNYTGEGVVTLRDFDGNFSKAKAAAKERARVDLASGIRVQVRSETSEKMELKGGKVTEEIKSLSESKVLLDLENITFLDFEDVPKQGELTVLAMLSKEDYRRQLAGKAANLFKRENGIEGTYAYQAAQGGVSTPLSGSAPGVEVFWRGISLGFRQFGVAYSFTAPPPDCSVCSGTYSTIENGGSAKGAINTISLGYDWTPWRSRFQIFVPLRINQVMMEVTETNKYLIVSQPGFPPNSTQEQPTEYRVNSWGASLGCGLRFWLNDAIALDVVGYVDEALGTIQNPSRTFTLGQHVQRVQIGLMYSSF